MNMKNVWLTTVCACVAMTQNGTWGTNNQVPLTQYQIDLPKSEITLAEIENIHKILLNRKDSEYALGKDETEILRFFFLGGYFHKIYQKLNHLNKLNERQISGIINNGLGDPQDFSVFEYMIDCCGKSGKQGNLVGRPVYEILSVLKIAQSVVGEGEPEVEAIRQEINLENQKHKDKLQELKNRLNTARNQASFNFK